MKTLLTGILLVFFTSGFAQKTKKVDIVSGGLMHAYISANYSYDENDKLIETNIHFFGQDARFSQLTEFITIFSGSPKDFFIFMNEVEKFFKENEPGTSSTIQGHYVSIQTIYGLKAYYLNEIKGNGFMSFTLKGFVRIKDKFVEWAKENGVPLTGV